MPFSAARNVPPMSPRNAVALLLVLCPAVSGCLATVTDVGAAERDARVTRVVDGDTIIVSLGGRRERVRYIGIDTPESVAPGRPVECFGPAASKRNAALVDGRMVRLEFDVERRDRYDRLLAYVRRVSDGMFVNAELVRSGYAQTMTIPPNVRYADRFLQLQREARREGRGLWGGCEQ